MSIIENEGIYFSDAIIDRGDNSFLTIEDLYKLFNILRSNILHTTNTNYKNIILNNYRRIQQ